MLPPMPGFVAAALAPIFSSAEQGRFFRRGVRSLFRCLSASFTSTTALSDALWRF